VTKLGRYRGLCSTCRPIVAAQQRAARAAQPPPTPGRPRDDDDGIEAEIRARSALKGKLKGVCQDLVGQAEKLEDALESRNAARVHAQVALSEFKEALQVVARVATSLVNVRAEPRDPA
jgi:hypothetical protein